MLMSLIKIILFVAVVMALTFGAVAIGVAVMCLADD